ncbi:DUF3347 domain-containing protein [Dyadobacter luticola]|uniref:DUF3347 domain-containing protein n=1 Tax=Dyadobacter luticola TaxID=1979387 RepID=A0A5R9KYX1_9BACT|nr:DUF3347 domain-containing protein [Dyadobacter luticola]TLV01381.1 DUF3347 domain-containing protein [Dyadobacter luticola]
MKSIQILMAMLLLLSSPSLRAEIKNSATESVKISGSCAMCKEGIEKAAQQKNISQADWNTQTQMAKITYDSKKTSLDAVLRRVALAGYDNASYLAPDDAYGKLADCCKYERVSKPKIMSSGELAANQAPAHQHHEGTSETNASAEMSPLSPVLKAYYAVKDALVSSDGNAASAKATELVKAIKAVKMQELADQQHMVWMKVMKDLAFDAEHIEETKDVGHQRDHFSSLSENMYKLVKAGKPAQAVYYQHCPMAKEGKGANWLSQAAEVKNPYYGAQMLTCGKTTETIK